MSPSNEAEDNKTLFINYLAALQKQFSLYFEDGELLRVEWVRNPFAANNLSELTTCEQEQLIDMSCDSSLKDMFGADKLPHTWLLMKNDYPRL